MLTWQRYSNDSSRCIIKIEDMHNAEKLLTDQIARYKKIRRDRVLKQMKSEKKSITINHNQNQAKHIWK